MLLSEIGGKISEICRKSEASTPPNFGEMAKIGVFKFRGNGIFQRKPLWHNEVTKAAKKTLQKSNVFLPKKGAQPVSRAPIQPRRRNCYSMVFSITLSIFAASTLRSKSFDKALQPSLHFSYNASSASNLSNLSLKSASFSGSKQSPAP